MKGNKKKEGKGKAKKEAPPKPNASQPTQKGIFAPVGGSSAKSGK